LDGKEVLRSERIRAEQALQSLMIELDILATECRSKKKIMQGTDRSATSDYSGIKEDEPTAHCPEVRSKLSREMAQQKAEKERNERSNQPRIRGEKEIEEEQRSTVERARRREERGEIRQCNGT